MGFNAESFRSSYFSRVPLAAPVPLKGRASQLSVSRLFGAIDRANAQSIADVLAVDRLDLTRINSDGQTPLHQAIALENQRGVAMLINKLQPEELEAKDGRGRTLLMAATEKGSLGPMDVLIRAGANINATADDNTTALMDAVARNDTRAALLLLSHGADVNHVGPGGRSSLMNAAQAGHLSMVILLLNFAANLALTDFSGDTARQIAKRNNHFGVAIALNSAAHFLKADDDNGLISGYVTA